MDTTHSTTKYANVTMLQIVVVDNLSKTRAVLYAWLDSESRVVFVKILKKALEWNPQWNPSHMMVDKCQAEIEAVKEVLPNTRILLCQFHRDQAWKRKVTVDLFGGSQEEAKEARDLLKRMGDSLKSADFDKYSKEFKV